MVFEKGYIMSQPHKDKIGKSLKGRIIDEEWRSKISKTLEGRHCSPRTEFKKEDLRISGENSNMWKGGVYKKLGRNEWQRRWRKENRHILLKKRREYRHKKGINKKWQYKSLGLEPPPTTYYRRISNFRRRKKVGKLEVRVVQRVYEDNIKKYGTLTCYLCFKEILFGKDTIDHKLPLSREGP